MMAKVIDLFVGCTCDRSKVDLLPRYREWGCRFCEDEGGKEYERRKDVQSHFGAYTEWCALYVGGDLQRIEQQIDGHRST